MLFLFTWIISNAQPDIMGVDSPIPYYPYYYHLDHTVSITRAGDNYIWKVVNGKMMDENGNFTLSSLDATEILEENFFSKIYVIWDCSDYGEVLLYKNDNLFLAKYIDIRPCESSITNKTFRYSYIYPLEGAYLTLSNVKVLSGVNINFHGNKSVHILPEFTAELGSKVLITSYIPPVDLSYSSSQRVITDLENNTTDIGFILGQNTPNPFNIRTKITCNISENANSSYVMISDILGRKIENIPIAQKGQIDIFIDGTNFASGIYVYSLIVDGKLIDTKRMVIK